MLSAGTHGGYACVTGRHVRAEMPCNCLLQRQYLVISPAASRGEGTCDCTTTPCALGRICCRSRQDLLPRLALHDDSSNNVELTFTAGDKDNSKACVLAAPIRGFELLL